MSVAASAAGRGVAEAIDRLRSYRVRLIKAGKLIEARAVLRCITILRE